MIKNPVGKVYDALLTQLEKDRVDLSTNLPYQCDLSLKELAGITGISEKEILEIYERVAPKKIFTQNNDKITINNVTDLFQEADFHRRASIRTKEVQIKQKI